MARAKAAYLLQRWFVFFQGSEEIEEMIAPCSSWNRASKSGARGTGFFPPFCIARRERVNSERSRSPSPVPAPVFTPARAFLVCGLIFLLAVICIPQTSSAYSVLTHEEIIDLAWNDSIRLLLLQRFPGTTEAGLRRAHAYAYGGCAIQDIGYYPFGHPFFSDLTHYVRTGDFIDSLLRNAHARGDFHHR